MSLCLKIRSNHAVPCILSIIQSLAKETVIGIACGDGQTIAVTTAGVRFIIMMNTFVRSAFIVV